MLMIFSFSRSESAAAAARKDSTPPNDSNIGGNAYALEHDSSASTSLMQGKDDSEQVVASFGDRNISVAVNVELIGN